MYMERNSQYCQDIISSHLIYRLNAIPIKTQASSFVNIDKLVLKLIQRDKRPRVANKILMKNKD